MACIRDNKRIAFLLALSSMFLIRDSEWFIYTAIVLFLVELFSVRSIDLDIGDIILFHSSFWYVMSRMIDTPWSFSRALVYVAIYQLGKKATDPNKNISPECVIAPALAFLLKGLLDYSSLFKYGRSDIELYWPDWGGNVLHRSEHEYYLVLAASLLVYFVYYTFTINRKGCIGIIISLGAVVLAVYAKGRLAFWSCLISVIVVGIGIIIEKKLYKLRPFRVAAVSFLAILAVVIGLLVSNTFGLHDLYMNSIWSEEGGPIYNARFDMMGQQIKLLYEEYFDETVTVEDDPALIDSDGNEIYDVPNSWLEIGRDKGLYTMMWTMAFTVYSLIYLVKAWKGSKDRNKYVVIAAFIGITFLNMVEPVITNNARFWALEVYLAGMVRALYTGACSPKRWDAGFLLKYV